MRDNDQILLEDLYSNAVFQNLYNLVVEKVDWDKFSDVSKVCYTPESVTKALNDELDRLKITKDRPKADLKFARISKGNIPTDEEGKANVEFFKKQLMQRPKTIFDKGEKSLHTSDENKITINTGIPALKAVIYDESDDKFYVINTCPGAGDCIRNCYAMQGFYIMNDGKNLKLLNRLQLMMNDPEQYEKMAFMEAERFAFEAQQEGKELKIRWNDAGDLFSETYFKIAVSVDKALKQKGYNSSSYIYTKMGKYMKLGEEENMKMTFSHGATKKQKDIVGDLSNVHTQITVPLDVFREFFISKGGKRFEKDENGRTQFKTPEAKEQLRKRIVDFYNTHPSPEYTYLRNKLDISRMKYTDELPSTEGQSKEFDTITLPTGDTDSPAQRKDVRFTFLTEH
jgi:hypothetical protein